MSTRSRKPRSKGFRVVDTRTGEVLSVVFPRREAAREALRKLYLTWPCKRCRAWANERCSENGVPIDLFHPERGSYGVQQVMEYDE